MGNSAGGGVGKSGGDGAGEGNGGLLEKKKKKKRKMERGWEKSGSPFRFFSFSVATRLYLLQKNKKFKGLKSSLVVPSAPEKKFNSVALLRQKISFFPSLFLPRPCK